MFYTILSINGYLLKLRRIKDINDKTTSIWQSANSNEDDDWYKTISEALHAVNIEYIEYEEKTKIPNNC